MTSRAPSRATASASAPLRRRRGPLAWGQQEAWTGFQASFPYDAAHTFSRVVEVPAALRPLDRERLDAALIGLVERHEGLRSLLVDLPDGLGQLVADAGPVAVTEVVAEPGGEPAAAALLAADLQAARFDYTGEWPLRVGAVRSGTGQSGPGITHVVLAFCHHVADGHASELVVRDLLTLLRGRAPYGPVGQPADLVAWQSSAGGRTEADTARRYWDEAFARVPDPMFGRPPADRFSSATHGTGDQLFEVRMVSPALAMALAELARRTGVSTATILMAATAVLIGRRTGHDVAGLVPTVGNRVRPENESVVSCLAQNGFFWLPVGAATGAGSFTALLPRARAAALQAYRWAYHDPADRLAHGDVFALHPYSGVNDMRARDRPGPAVDRGTVRRAQEWTTLTTCVRRPERLICRFYLRITDQPGGTGLEVQGDPRYVPSSVVADFGPDLEELVASAAFAGGGRP